MGNEAAAQQLFVGSADDSIRRIEARCVGGAARV